MIALRTFEVKVHRDGKWWMVEIPEIDGLTQARRLADVEDMARSYIAVDQDLAPSEIQLVNPRVWVEGKDLSETMKEILALRAAAKESEEAAAALMVRTARELAADDVPLRDIGEVLDVSHQRVHQLLHDQGKADFIVETGDGKVVAVEAKSRQRKGPVGSDAVSGRTVKSPGATGPNRTNRPTVAG